jgi:uncharacterized membrane protein YidH (DUF202 family)
MDSDKERNDAFRTQQHLANQRTFLAWLRTSVALIGLGFVVSGFGLFLKAIIVGHGLSVTTRSKFSLLLIVFSGRDYYGGSWYCLHGFGTEELSRYMQIHNERIVPP